MRERFLIDPTIAFLNHGSFGACPKEVLETCRVWTERMERNPVQFLARDSGRLIEEALTRLGAFVGARSEDLAFMPNSTHSVNTVARSLVLGPGDEILTTDHEYGACDLTWEHVASATGARIVRVALPLPFVPGDFVEGIMSRITPATRVISVSHITSPTGLLFPIEDLCRRARERGVLTLIDGAHAPGQIDLALDALGADFYAGNCHKWMCAPKGSAFLYVRPEHHGRVHAGAVSWGYHRNSPTRNAFTGTGLLARRLQWQGTRDIVPFLTVAAAIDFLEDIDWRARNARSRALARAFGERCAERAQQAPIGPAASQVLMCAVPIASTEPERLQWRLMNDYRIEVPVTTQGGRTFVRASVFGYTTEEELTRLFEALDQLAVWH